MILSCFPVITSKPLLKVDVVIPSGRTVIGRRPNRELVALFVDFHHST
jgi:hypothetical protein